jgi:hypothetical protein
VVHCLVDWWERLRRDRREDGGYELGSGDSFKPTQ